jgi:hypothetical protein
MPFKSWLTPFLIVAVMLLSVSATPAQAGVQTNLKVPLTIGVFIPCAADGAGEVVFLTGNLHVLLRLCRRFSLILFSDGVRSPGTEGSTSGCCNLP